MISLSTDKAAAPVNLYGATKLCSDKLSLLQITLLEVLIFVFLLSVMEMYLDLVVL